MRERNELHDTVLVPEPREEVDVDDAAAHPLNDSVMGPRGQVMQQALTSRRRMRSTSVQPRLALALPRQSADGADLYVHVK